MSGKNRPQRSKQENGERVFVIVAVALCLVLGSGFCALLFALNYRAQPQQAAYDTLPDSRPVLIEPDHPRSLADFSLTDSRGRSVSREDLDGKILVVDFLFTSCSQTCPAVNTQMAQIQQLTTNEADVKLVSITVDPRDDTPDVLAKYGERFGADTNRWVFLTGTKTALYGLIATSFLSQDLNDPQVYMPGNFSHTERIAIVDERGRLRGFFDGLNQNAADAVVEEIGKLRSEKL